VTYITHKGWTLQYTIGDVVAGPVSVGDVVDSFRGETYIVVGGASPHKVGSTGRVYVRIKGDYEDRGSMEFFPSVIGARWVNPLVDAVTGLEP
jgi:hypothetical protein